MKIFAACNRLIQSCGCVNWLQLENGGWMRKHWPCFRHVTEKAN